MSVIGTTRGQTVKALCVGVLALCVAAVGHFHGHRIYLDHLDTDRSLFPPLPPSRWRAPVVVPPGARRVWVVVIDGLRDDVGDRMPALRRLAAAGVRRTLLADLPSYTFPGLKMLASGVPPQYSGTRLNSGRSPLHYQTLVDVAAGAGVPVRLSTDGAVDFEQALDLTSSSGVHHDYDQAPLARLTDAAARHELVFVHLGKVDDAGHGYGGASQEYTAAATAADAEVGRLAAAMDPLHDVLLVVSDHGHLDRGGHGGDEPAARRGYFLAYGALVRRGIRLPPGHLRDVCATIALLTGLPPPGQNLGAPMIDVLAMQPAEAARAIAPSWTQRAQAAAWFAPPLARHVDPSPLTAGLVAGDADAIALVEAQFAADDATREGILRDELRRRMARRLPVALFVAAGVAALLALLHRRRVIVLRPVDVLAPGVTSALFTAGYLAFGYSFGWSMPRGAAGFLIETAVVGGLASAGGLATVHWCARGRLVPATSVVVSACIAAYAVAVAVSGLDPAWLEGPRASFALVVTATFVFYAGGGFGLAVLACTAGAAIRARTRCRHDAMVS